MANLAIAACILAVVVALLAKNWPHAFIFTVLAFLIGVAH